MFTLTTTPVTFIGLTVLFIWCILWSARDLLAAIGIDLPASWAPAEPLAHRTPIAISQSFHLVMSIVMLVMVPRAWWTALPEALRGPTLIAVMAAGAIWMAAMAIWKISWLAVGHTAMFAAMVWHLASMASHTAMSMTGASAARPSSGHSGMAGMGHPASPAATTGPSGLTLVTGVGLPLMACLLVLGISGLVRAITGRPPHPGQPACCHTTPTTAGSARLSGLFDAAMGLGMAWMSAGLMSPLIPVLGHLHP